MAATLPCVELGPPRGQAKQLVVWLHGLGASGHDFEPIVPFFGQRFDTSGVRFVFPHAPVRAVTINMGMTMPAWYDILRLDHTGVRESDTDIQASHADVSALLDAEIEAGVPASSTILVGFSQGGAMALHVGNRYPQTLAGIIVLSAYQLRTASLETEASAANAATPMFFGHGSKDAVVPLRLGEQAHKAMGDRRSPETRPHFRTYPMAHEVCPQEIADIAEFMAEHFQLGDA